MAQSAKHLPCKHKGLSLISKSHIRKARHSDKCICNPSTREAEASRSLELPGHSFQSSIRQIGHFASHLRMAMAWGVLLKIKQGENLCSLAPETYTLTTLSLSITVGLWSF